MVRLEGVSEAQKGGARGLAELVGTSGHGGDEKI